MFGPFEKRTRPSEPPEADSKRAGNGVPIVLTLLFLAAHIPALGLLQTPFVFSLVFFFWPVAAIWAFGARSIFFRVRGPQNDDETLRRTQKAYHAVWNWSAGTALGSLLYAFLLWAFFAAVYHC
jgi:hypothetical protein